MMRERTDTCPAVDGGEGAEMAGKVGRLIVCEMEEERVPERRKEREDVEAEEANEKGEANEEVDEAEGVKEDGEEDDEGKRVPCCGGCSGENQSSGEDRDEEDNVADREEVWDNQGWDRTCSQ